MTKFDDDYYLNRRRYRVPSVSYTPPALRLVRLTSPHSFTAERQQLSRTKTTSIGLNGVETTQTVLLGKQDE